MLLATAAGVLFGALNNSVVEKSSNLSKDHKSEYEDFFSMGYIAAGFLLIVFISAAVSSVVSSLRTSSPVKDDMMY